MSNGRKYRRAVRRGDAVFALPEIADDDAASVKDAVAIRNAATRTGKCPSCGAVAEIVAEPKAGEIGHASMEHRAECPALLGGDR